MLKPIRILLVIHAYYDYDIYKFNVKTVFLNGNFHEDTYITQPEGFKSKTFAKKICKLHKPIYRLKYINLERD